MITSDEINECLFQVLFVRDSFSLYGCHGGTKGVSAISLLSCQISVACR